MKLSILAGATSQTINVFVQDSSSTTGAGLTGLVYNSASLTAYYVFPRATAAAITLATLAAANSAWSSGGFKEIDATNMPGWYRLDLPDAVLASGNGRSVGLHLKGAANMAPLPIEIELTGWNNQDGVRGGLTALPNATAGANTGLPVVGTQIPNATAGASGGMLISGANSGTTTLGALTITGAMSINGTGNVAQTGDNYARLGAPAGASVSADIAAAKVDTAAIKAKTDQLAFTLPGLVDANSSGGLSAAQKKAVAKRLQEPAPLVAIGTHALFQEGVRFGRLGLAVIDEQLHLPVDVLARPRPAQIRLTQRSARDRERAATPLYPRFAGGQSADRRRAAPARWAPRVGGSGASGQTGSCADQDSI